MGAETLFTAISIGETRFVINNAGNVQINNLSTGSNGVVYATSGTGVLATTTTSSQNQCLISTYSTPIWGNCAMGTNEWQQINGAISPTAITDDMVLGGTSTNSARFAFINDIGAGTPTASISANNGANATYLTGAGVLGTTNGQSLTIGSTGNVQFYNSNNTITSAGNLTLAGTTGINLSGASADINFTGTGANTITTAAGQYICTYAGRQELA